MRNNGLIMALSVSMIVLMLLVGFSYGYVVSVKTESLGNENAKYEVTTSPSRDFERNIFVVDIKKDAKITYSVVQSNELKADLNGLSPSNVLVKQGDTVKFSIKSDVNCNFVVDGYGIRARTYPSTTTEVQFNADLPGTYAYQCDGFLKQRVGLLEVVR